MGTVGLSFGSPTSGTGFNVSQTVSQIVANLQNIETPWKTQLSSLTSQDAAISNLGTLLSNLSNDVNALTDFTGIMAQKTGSSSDENVLELTGATSAATAGTHTVVVNSLAQTSSGYLTELPSSSTTFTVGGAITLQVGDGATHTITLDSTDNTLAGLSKAINAAGIGITASVLTDASGSRLSLVSGTSGAEGNITVNASSLTAQAGPVVSYLPTNSSSGTIGGLTNSGDTISSGKITIQLGNNAAQVINVNSSDNTLAGIQAAIANNPALAGLTATLNSDGTGISLSAGAGTTLNVSTSGLSDSTTTSMAMNYISTVTGADASLTIDGVPNLTSSSNTVSNLIPGLTFQLLSISPTQTGGSLEPVQVVIANDNQDVESVVATMVMDYNSLISAVNLQQGNTASGTPEPLFGSPTLSLLQAQLMQSLNTQNPNGSLTAIASDTGTTLSGTISVQAGTGKMITFHMADSTDTNTATDIYVAGNTLEDLAAAIKAADANTPVAYTAGTGTTLGTISEDSTTALGGSISFTLGSGKPEYVTIPAGGTLSDYADAVNNDTTLQTEGVTATATTDSSTGITTLTLQYSGSGELKVNSQVVVPGIGLSANVITSNGESYLNLLSGTTGSNGALSVTSKLTATSNELLGFTDAGYSGTQYDTGTFGSVNSASDVLSGSMTIKTGTGTPLNIVIGAGTNDANTIYTGAGKDTIADVVNAITSYSGYGGLGFTAQLNSSGTGILLSAETVGSDGALTVNSSLLDTSVQSTSTLAYNNSSDLSTLSSLGITTSQNYDGTLSFDAQTLDTALNTDFSGVLGFFQSINSWGTSFANMLDNAGTSTSTGGLKLALNSDSNVESTLNADISKEDALISAQQKSITAELNSANEILQGIPTQLQGLNELYSAISGYNTNSNG